MVVLTGGGVKGAVLAARAAREHEPVLVHVAYGQPAAQAEQAAVVALARTLPAARVVTLELPQAEELRYGAVSRPTRASSGDGRGSAAVQINSRALMPLLLSLGVQWALRAGAPTVVTGLSRMIDAAHLGFPATDGRGDREREFLHLYNIMLDLMLVRSGGVAVEAPLMDLTYCEVMKLAFRFQVPLEKTRTCARQTPRACGRCEACTARASALADADLADPLLSPAAGRQA